MPSPGKSAKGRGRGSKGRGRGRGRGNTSGASVNTNSDCDDGGMPVRPGKIQSKPLTPGDYDRFATTEEIECDAIPPERQSETKPNPRPRIEKEEQPEKEEKQSDSSSLPTPTSKNSEAEVKLSDSPRPKEIKPIETKQEPIAVPLPTVSVAKKLANLSIKGTGATASSDNFFGQCPELKPLRRPPTSGTKGRKISLRANFFRIRLRGGDAYHYDVEVEPTVVPKRIKRAVIRQLVGEFQSFFRTERPVFDGQKNLFTRNPLPIRNGKETMKLMYKDDPDDKGREFTVTIQLAARVSLDMLNQAFTGKGDIPQEAIQVIDIVLRNLPSYRYIPVGRSFFSQPEGEICHLGDGREVWFGHFQSVRPTQWNMLLNVNTVATAFYKTQPVLDFLCEILKFRSARDLRPLTDSQRKNFEKQVKGLKVEYTYIQGQKRKKRVKGVGKLSPEKQTFWNENEKKNVTVSDYFKDAYKIRLQYSFLPCMELGTDKSFVHVPLELLTLVPGQRCIKRLNEAQTAQMIRATARSAPDRKRDIQTIMRDAQFDKDEFAKHFGIEVDQNMVSLSGRVLDAPAIEYRSSGGNVPSKEQPRQGKWDMRNQKFFTTNSVNNWAVLNFAPRMQEQTLNNFGRQLCDVAYRNGLCIGNKPFIKYDSRIGQEKESFDEAIRNVPNIQLILAIITGQTELYNEIKKLGDTKYGIPTQCIVDKTVSRANPQLLSNLCMKINTKLGGINNKVLMENKPRRVFENPVLILGADVTHPPARDTTKPSIAAVVGSLDAGPTTYCAKVRVQKHRQEIIADLKSIVVELLKAFYKATRQKPHKIIMYRDGVGEGQFQQVLDFELQAIREACLSLNKEYRPAITFLTVQKRHHIRLFAEEKRDQVGKSGNVPAGTTVDTTICHPVNFDFYLCSHDGIQGTSRPAHYQVLWDESQFTPDELQQLTYVLCHQYARCTRSVSIPAPAYYAHHVAFRARAHIDERQGDSESSSNGSNGSNGFEKETITKALQEAATLHADMQQTMYFV